jgi:hypothetical protein
MSSSFQLISNKKTNPIEYFIPFGLVTNNDYL